MVTITTLRKMALAFPETSEEPHFEKTSFRVGKKIFATYDASTNEACFKLSEADQDVFSLYDKEAIYPVPNKWGQQGWTMVRLAKVRKDMFTDALTTAYCHVAPRKLALQVRPAEEEVKEKVVIPKKDPAKKTTASATATSVASATKEVDAFMKELVHPLHDVATALRKIILGVDKTIGEEIAWSAPAFIYTGPMKPFAPKEYKRFIVGMNLVQKNCVRLIFLHGADADNSSGMLEGDYKDGRRMALFRSMEEVKNREKDLKKIVKQLLAQIDK